MCSVVDAMICTWIWNKRGRREQWGGQRGRGVAWWRVSHNKQCRWELEGYKRHQRGFIFFLFVSSHGSERRLSLWFTVQHLSAAFRVTRLMQTSILSLTTQISVLEGTAGLAKGAMFLSSSATLCVLFLCMKCLHANKVLAFSCCYLKVMSTRFKPIGGELNLGTPPLCFQTDCLTENCNLYSVQGAILKG